MPLMKRQLAVYSGIERAMSVAFTTFRTFLLSLFQGQYGNTLYILSSFIRLLSQTNTKTVAACNLTAWARAAIQSFFSKRNWILCERTTWNLRSWWLQRKDFCSSNLQVICSLLYGILFLWTYIYIDCDCWQAHVFMIN